MDIRANFPQLARTVNGKPLVYLDNAASTLKCRSVIDRVSEYYSQEVANIHRGAHYLGDLGTTNYEAARETIAAHINAASASEVIFTRGTTEAINLVAHSLWASGDLKSGDLIVLSEMEHHSNIVPWMMLKERAGLRVEFMPITDQGDIDMEAAAALIKKGPKLVAFTHISNALGTLNPVEALTKLSKEQGALVLIDGAQALAARPVDVRQLNCDFYVASGHKVFAPTGIGFLYGRLELLNRLPPYQGGGSMISQVTTQEVSFLPSPQRFEAGTPHVAGAIGFAEALRFLDAVDFEVVQEREEKLVSRLLAGLSDFKGIRLVGTPKSRVNVVSFLFEGCHPSDVGALLDQQGVAVRAGHHCCMPLMKRLGVVGTVRASVAPYNSEQDVDAFLAAVLKAKEILL